MPKFWFNTPSCGGVVSSWQKAGFLQAHAGGPPLLVLSPGGAGLQDYFWTDPWARCGEQDDNIPRNNRRVVFLKSDPPRKSPGSVSGQPGSLVFDTST
jgi:hypothetical protein